MKFDGFNLNDSDDGNDEFLSELTQIIDVAKSLLNAVAEDDELLSTTAKLYFNTYQSYIKAGFTQEQAFQLLTTQGPVKVK